MINFIICDDNKYVRDINKNIISKLAMPYDFNYKIYSFEKYNKEFKKIINSTVETKIYILDLELPNKTGIEIAREIRKVDWDSFIIVLTSHDELELKILKQKLLILDFISKFDNYEQKLTDTINMIINKKNDNTLSFKCNRELHNIKNDNILFIYKNTALNKITIVTKENSYNVRESLSNIVKKLNNKFYQTHRACYVNLSKIQKVDFKQNLIFFENSIKCDYLSRNYKKGLKERL
ncbi:MAG: response regulator transcription factor [Bacilli bacterium]|nr:response regulator transcription factor [Bacilli bacterium]